MEDVEPLKHAGKLKSATEYLHQNSETLVLTFILFSKMAVKF